MRYRPGDQSVQVQLEGAGEEVGDDVVAAVDALGVRAHQVGDQVGHGPHVHDSDLVRSCFGGHHKYVCGGIAYERRRAIPVFSTRPGVGPGLIPAPTGFEPGPADS